MRRWHDRSGSILAVVIGLAFLLAWQLLVYGSERRNFLYGSPSAVLAVLVADFGSGELIRHTLVTGVETSLGLLVGSILGTLIGLSMWADVRLGRVLLPYSVVAGAIPVFALAPVLIMWFGTGLLAKVVMASFATCLVSLTQAYEGSSVAAENYTPLARSLGATRMQTLRYFIAPGALRWVVTGVRLNVGFALVGAFIGEFISSEAGVGHYMLRAGGRYDVPRVFAGVVLLAVIALTLTAIIRSLARFVAPWLEDRPATVSEH